MTDGFVLASYLAAYLVIAGYAWSLRRRHRRGRPRRE
jgi:hypothetical protein